MKSFFSLLLAAVFLSLAALSCHKDDNTTPVKYGVDGMTPLPEAVDIGLVVDNRRVLWANFNLGASRECDYGDYYAWGELNTKAIYDESNYSYKDRPKVLPADRDAATVKLGGRWRLPTHEEFEALLALASDSDKYQLEEMVTYKDARGKEIRDADGNVVCGLRITQKKTGYSLFFPAAGYGSGTARGKDGAYWSSSTFSIDPTSVYYLAFDSGRLIANVLQMRSSGLPIRPVYAE